ncbi:unnamed protein product [Ranitomeya imitator]|uniref:Transmembrane protein 195 n=1 Tax=Ranitomeya imitator TaxID=111125 RepID=A0ABN9LAK6_9NEOB|nr:unnamed protein product [Ranitomeya imitator]
MFYWPMALFIPPSVFAVHLQFNLLYQFWIHTEFINNLGPLELILNTPSHHRVHHGRNPYCIDSNYAGTLIIWDRIFGTFVPEKDKVVYGLTHPVNTFDPFNVQDQDGDRENLGLDSRKNFQKFTWYCKPDGTLLRIRSGHPLRIRSQIRTVCT